MTSAIRARARRQAATIAADVLAGRLSPVIGAVELNFNLRADLDVSADDEDFKTFMLIDSECDGMPIGPVRQYWSPEALAQKEPDVQRAERWAMKIGRQAFQSIVARFTGADEPAVS